MNARSLIPVTWLMAAAVLSGAARADDTIDQQIAADPHGTVEINSRDGSIQCVGWDKPEVSIKGELSRSAEKIDVQREGSTITIRVLAKTGMHISGDTHLQVMLPATNTLRVSAVSADVEVSRVVGEQRLQTVSGDMSTDAAGADLSLKSISGNIKARGKGGTTRTTVSTVSGNTEVSNIGGQLDLDTVSGDVEIDLGTVSRMRLQTISGDVVMAGKLNSDTRVDVSSVSGDVHMRWVGAENSNIEVESFSGEISSCFSSVAVQRPKFGPGSSWRYSGPGAASTIHVKSLSGDVKVCNR